MSTHPPRGRLQRRLIRRAGWLVGAPLTTFRFLTRRTPVERVASAGQPLPTAPTAGDDRRLGFGPLTHRIYSVRIRGAKLSPEQLTAIIAADPDVIAPSEVMRFERSNGPARGLREGDELRIVMAGPWDEPVRVTARWPRGFRLASTRGHAMLGQFELRVEEEDSCLILEIQTRQRAARRSFRLLEVIGVIERMQLHTWSAMLENAARVAGGCPPDRVVVRTWRTAADATAAPPRPAPGAA